MNSIFMRIGIAALLSSVKNPVKREGLKDICRDIVRGILLAYADDDKFMNELLDPEE